MIPTYRNFVLIVVCLLSVSWLNHELAAQSEPTGENPLIRAYQQLLEHSDFEDEDDVEKLREILAKSDALLTRIKRDNAKALKNVNRLPPRLNTVPNVVLIFVDNLSPEKLGCYGSKSENTPAIDELAKSGVQFSEFLAGSPDHQDAFWCLMTGHHTGEIKRDQEGSPVFSSHKLAISSQLWHAGYETGFFGHWPLPSVSPQDCYYDLFIGWNDASRHGEAFPPSIQVNGLVQEFNQDQKDSLNAWNMTTMQALAALERRDSQRPFGWILRYRSLNFSDETDEVAMLDAEIRRLMNRLDQLSLRENTLIWFMGETANTVPQELTVDSAVTALKTDHLKVPSILRYPRIIPGDRKISLAAGGWDVSATLATIVKDRRYYRGSQGQSLLGPLTSRQTLHNRVLYWRVPVTSGGSVQGARWGHWKGVVRPEDPKIRLYNLSNDPQEESNVADQHPEVLKKLVQPKANR